MVTSYFANDLRNCKECDFLENWVVYVKFLTDSSGTVDNVTNCYFLCNSHLKWPSKKCSIFSRRIVLLIIMLQYFSYTKPWILQYSISKKLLYNINIHRLIQKVTLKTKYYLKLKESCLKFNMLTKEFYKFSSIRSQENSYKMDKNYCSNNNELVYLHF